MIVNPNKREPAAYACDDSLQTSQQRPPQPHTKAGDIAPCRTQPTLAVAGRKVDVQPGTIPDEATQEARRKDMVGRAVERALLDVGDFRFDRLIVIRIVG